MFKFLIGRISGTGAKHLSSLDGDQSNILFQYSGFVQTCLNRELKLEGL
jgi:hypothetical protein